MVLGGKNETIRTSERDPEKPKGRRGRGPMGETQKDKAYPSTGQ